MTHRINDGDYNAADGQEDLHVGRVVSTLDCGQYRPLSFMGWDPLHPPSLSFSGQLFTYECATEVHQLQWRSTKESFEPAPHCWKLQLELPIILILLK